jgi:hypothetical protein
MPLTPSAQPGSGSVSDTTVRTAGQVNLEQARILASRLKGERASNMTKKPGIEAICPVMFVGVVEC